METVLIQFGCAHGSTPRERAAVLPGDDTMPAAKVQTDHAVTIDAPPSVVWNWLVQTG